MLNFNFPFIEKSLAASPDVAVTSPAGRDLSATGVSELASDVDQWQLDCRSAKGFLFFNGVFTMPPPNVGYK